VRIPTIRKNTCLQFQDWNELLVHLLMISLRWHSETSVSAHKTTLCRNPQGCNFNSHRLQNLRTYISNFRNVRIRPQNDMAQHSGRNNVNNHRRGNKHLCASSVGVGTCYVMGDRAEARDFYLHSVQTTSGTRSASYPRGAERFFPGGKAAGAWRWQLHVMSSARMVEL
jgi:hypothetical protein